MARRTVVATLLVAVSASCVSDEPMPSTSSDSQHLMYVGTYTRETSAGIYAYRFDSESGTAEELGLVAEMREPSFLALHPTGQYLYAVSETDDFDEDGSGSVVSFQVSANSGALTKLNEVSSRGGWPCHINVDARRSHADRRELQGREHRFVSDQRGRHRWRGPPHSFNMRAVVSTSDKTSLTPIRPTFRLTTASPSSRISGWIKSRSIEPIPVRPRWPRTTRPT